MKKFEEISFVWKQCADELERFRVLLGSKGELPERDAIKPFFESARQLSAFIGTYVPEIGPANLLAYEFQIGGDFAADLVVGDRESQTFCMVEFEGAAPGGIFHQGVRSTKEWNVRFEHGFSQLVDWFYALDDLRGTGAFEKNFGYGHARFYGLLVIGRSAGLLEEDRRRLRWRSERVLVDSHPVLCITYDELHEHLLRRLRRYPAAESVPQAREK